MKKAFLIVMSLLLASCFIMNVGCSALKASEDDGSVSAGTQQTTVVAEHAPVTVDIPAPQPAPEPPKAAEPAPEPPKAAEPAPEPPKAAEPAPEAPKAEEPAPEAPKAEEPAPEAPKTEEPVPEAPKTDEPAVTETEDPDKETEGAPALPENPAPQEEPTEEPVEPEAESEPAEPIDEEPVDEEPVTEEPVEEEFTGKVVVRMVAPNDLTYGDSVTLKADVSGTNKPYTIRWEAYIGGSWTKIGSGSSYSFVVTEENASLSYRAVLVSQD